MKAFQSLLALAVLAAMSFTLAGCGGGSSPTSQNKPEDVFNTFHEALKKDDWTTAAQCLTRESQETMAAGLVTAAIGMKMIPDLPGAQGDELKANVKKMDRVLDKHGITEAKLQEWQDQKLGPETKENLLKFAEPIQDEPAFIADMMKVMKEIQKDKDSFTPPDAKLTDVKINGDTATGKMVFTQKGQEETEPVHFLKEQGSWRIQLHDGPKNKQ